MQLEKVQIRSVENSDSETGGAHFAIFVSDSDGSTVINRITPRKHFSMKKIGGFSRNPKLNGYQFVGAFATYEYDTADGELAEGQYAEDGDICICRLTGTEKGELYSIRKENMPDGNVDRAEVDRINDEFNKNIAYS